MSSSFCKPKKALNQGNPASEKDILPWRLVNDLSLVSFERTLYPICKLLRKLAIEKGIGSLEIEDHLMSARLHPVVFCPQLLVTDKCSFFGAEQVST